MKPTPDGDLGGRCGFAVGVQKQEGLRQLTAESVGVTKEMGLESGLRMNLPQETWGKAESSEGEAGMPESGRQVQGWSAVWVQTPPPVKRCSCESGVSLPHGLSADCPGSHKSWECLPGS